MQRFQNKDIISMADFTKEEIIYLCEKAQLMYQLEKSGQRHMLQQEFKHKSISYMFYEPSTRTKTSFLTAMRELGGHFDGFSGVEGTSTMKKETIRDTIMMMAANHADVLVMRHPRDGSLQWAADVSPIPVINAGDGKNEHPTQSLLDLFTLFQHNHASLDNIKIGFGGDLKYGRTIRSLSMALSHFQNITIVWSAPDMLALPEDLQELLIGKGVIVIRKETVEEVLAEVTFYYMTRPQLERMEEPEKVHKLMEQYRITQKKISSFKGILLHPLPVNSEIEEITYEVYFSSCQGFFAQAENGVFMRKALLHELLKNNHAQVFSGMLHKELRLGNNKLMRHIKHVAKEQQYVDRIDNGIVVDHIQENKGKELAALLQLAQRGITTITAFIAPAKKSFLKTDLLELTERELKKISLLSPEATINFIRDGKILEKFVYVLCQNKNCISCIIEEDVPPKFYQDNGTIYCRYCRHPYKWISKKITDEEFQQFTQSLPKAIDKVD